jgi:predicted protein tyrosine phosphatase
MEEKHRSFLLQRFPLAFEKQIVLLNIHPSFANNPDELNKILIEKLKDYLEN